MCGHECAGRRHEDLASGQGGGAGGAHVNHLDRKSLILEGRVTVYITTVFIYSVFIKQLQNSQNY